MRALARSRALGRGGRARSAPSRCAATSPTAPRCAAGAEGCDAAFHLAAHLGQWGTREEFIARQRRPGPRTRSPAAARPGVRRFVHCGTEAALIAGEPLRRGRRDGAAAPRLEGALLGDQGAGRAGGPRGERATASRPSCCGPRFVWGEGDTTLLPEIVAMVEAGQVRLDRRRRPPHRHHPRRQRRRGAAARRRARAAPARPTSSPTASRSCSASSSPRCSRPRASSRRPGRCPAWLARRRSPPAREAAWRLLRLGGEPPLTRFAFWLSSQECTIDISKARAELGYEPVVIAAGSTGSRPQLRERPVAALRPARARARRSAASRAGRRSAPGTVGPALDDLAARSGSSAEKRSTSSSSSSRSPARGPSSAGRRRGRRSRSSRSSRRPESARSPR